MNLEVTCRTIDGQIVRWSDEGRAERRGDAVITQLRGVLRTVGEEELTLAVEPFDFEVLIPEHARKQLQGKLGEFVTLHTVFYIEGNQMGGKMLPRLVGFLSPWDREFFDIFCSVDSVGVRKALRAMARPVRELAVRPHQYIRSCPVRGEAPVGSGLTVRTPVRPRALQADVNQLS